MTTFDNNKRIVTALRQQQAASSATTSETRNILVVDDDPALLEAIAAALEEAGYPVAAVTSGREALQWIQATEAAGEPPALILLDLAMPGINGQQVIAALRQHGGANNVPIIMLSTDHQAQPDGRESGTLSLLSKPIEMNLLVTHVKRFVDCEDTTL